MWAYPHEQFEAQRQIGGVIAELREHRFRKAADQQYSNLMKSIETQQSFLKPLQSSTSYEVTPIELPKPLKLDFSTDSSSLEGLDYLLGKKKDDWWLK